jgi:hypothetical protein
VNLLQEILDRENQIELTDGELVAGFDDVGPGQTIIGTLPEQLRRRFAVLVESRDQMNALNVQLQEKINSLREAGELTAGLLDSIRLESEMARHRHQEIYDLFWGAVRRTMPRAFEAKGLGICKEWQVVATFKSVCDDCPARYECRPSKSDNIIRDIFGGAFRNLL